MKGNSIKLENFERKNKSKNYATIVAVIALIISLILVVSYAFYAIEKNYDLIGARYNKIDKCTKIIGQTYEFDFEPNEQSFTPTCDGYYQIEAWGASGGNAAYGAYLTYGYGGYTAGSIELSTTDTIHIFTGERGKDGAIRSGFKTDLAFNGGGRGVTSSDVNDGSGGGGGATDIRLSINDNKDWDDFASLKSRIMVAGGGAGSPTSSPNTKITTPRAGHGGGLTGVGSVWYWENQELAEHDLHGTQTSGYKFGQGEDGLSLQAAGSGGGGGYYGGKELQVSYAGYPEGTGGGGGSSYISGHDGCLAIEETSTEDNITHKTDSIHYSNRVFDDTIMIDGEGYLWEDERKEYVGQTQPDGTVTSGHVGNGHVRITYLGNGTKIKYDHDSCKTTYMKDKFTNLCKPKRNEYIFQGWYYNGELVTDGMTIPAGKVINLESRWIEGTDVGATFEYAFGDDHLFKVPEDGIYQIEAWGASGGLGDWGAYKTYGYGGYTSGEILLTKNENLYVFVGEQGKKANIGCGTQTEPAYNGGGRGITDSECNDAGGGGGGASDIRTYVNSTEDWDDFDSLKSRIMVAGAGAGSPTTTGDSSITTPRAGHGGGLTGVGSVWYWQNKELADHDLHGTQTTGYQFGVGRDAIRGSSAGSGAGGGYYGGNSKAMGNFPTGGGGGSSYISGHNGCLAIKSTYTAANPEHADNSIHYSGYQFYNTKIIDGEGYLWKDTKKNNVGITDPDGKKVNGHYGNGYVRITYLGKGIKVNYDNASCDPTLMAQKYQNLCVPKRLGYKFKGWSYNGEVVSNGMRLPNTTEITLISSWEEGIEIGTTYEYDFGDDHLFKVPATGKYKIEAWGASGGEAASGAKLNYGLGAYTSGNINLTKDEELFVFVGEKGPNGRIGSSYRTAQAYNGGGRGTGSSDNDDGSGGGGGATDIRTYVNENQDWDDFDSLKSRIMVAGAGAGSATNSSTRNDENAGHGGGLTGVGSVWYWENYEITNHDLHGTQTSGYKFGIGQDGLTLSAAGSGGGAGYFGGKDMRAPNGAGTGAGGGSSYISGHDGCIAIEETSTLDNITFRANSIHYSNRRFYNTKMIDGQGYLWKSSRKNLVGMTEPDGTRSNGHDGNGFVRITYLGTN